MAHRSVCLSLFVVGTLAAGCDRRMGGYTAASAMIEGGFAREAKEMGRAQGREVKLWGYVDHGNLYGDARAKEILGDWWSGDGPDSATWRFDLKAKEKDETGHSFAVHVLNDAGRDGLLEAFLDDARARKPTRVFVTGRLFAFDAPTNFSSRTGLYLNLRSSRDILLRLPEE